MGNIGALYYIPEGDRDSWRASLEQLGFRIEDLSSQISDEDRRTILFHGTLTNLGTKRLIEMQRWPGGYVLAVRFAGPRDDEFLNSTIGLRFSAPARPDKGKA